MTSSSPPPQLLTPVQAVRAGIERDPDLKILTFVDISDDGSLRDTTKTYGELLADAEVLAGALNAAGMRADDRFALLMPNDPEFIDAMIASELAGTQFVPIDPRTRGDRLAYMLNFTECKGVIASIDAVANLSEIVDRVPSLKWIWVVGDDDIPPLGGGVSAKRYRDAVAASEKPAAWPEPDLLRPMQFLFTSGTTGDPKAMLAPYARYATVSSYGQLVCMTRDDKLYTGLSLTHANAQMITLGNALAMGLPVVISRKFSKSRLWEILAKYECTYFNLLGGMTVAIFAEPESPFEANHKVRLVLSAGMPAKMWEAFEKRFGVRVCEIYGAAEGGLSINLPDTGPIGSIGKQPDGWHCVIQDESGQEVGPGEIGEITFKPVHGDVPTVEYYRNPEATEAKTRGGWFRTGDMGYKDKDGWLFFSHRKGSAIRRNGDFINPGDLETVIAKISGVDDVFVYGVETEQNTPGEREVVAALVLEAGFDTPIEILAHCRRVLGPSMTPSFLQIVDEIPKTASEKPMERKLVELIRMNACTLLGTKGPIQINLVGGKK